MLTKATIENLTPLEFSLLAKEDVLRPEVLDRIEQIAQDASFEFEPGEAVDFLDSLDELVSNHQEDIKADQGAYKRYIQLLWDLRWRTLPTLKIDERAMLLSKNLVFSLSQGFAVKEWFQRLMRIFEFGTYPEADDRKKYIRALTQNQEKVGSNQINLKSQKGLKPTVQNWIKDYNEAVGLNKEHGRFAQTNYMDTSQNVAGLNAEDRQVVRKVIELFDWLQYPQLSGEFISVRDAERQLNSVSSKRVEESAVVKTETLPAPPRPRATSEEAQSFSRDEPRKVPEEFDGPIKDESVTRGQERPRITSSSAPQPAPRPSAPPAPRQTAPEPPPQQQPTSAASQRESAQTEQDEFAKKLEALTSKPLSGEGRGSIGGIKQPPSRQETVVSRQQESKIAPPPAAPPKPKPASVSEDKAGESEIQKLMEQQPKPQESKADPFSVNEAIARVGQKTPELGEIVSPSDEQPDAGQVENKKQEGEKQDNSQDQGRITPGL